LASLLAHPLIGGKAHDLVHCNLLHDFFASAKP
jgi:hypothetical protein